MKQVERDMNRCLTLVRNKIREKGFTQLEVQAALGWGRSYISQLFTGTKKLRIEQLLLILNVIEVDPAQFFGELYDLAGLPGPGRQDLGAPEARLPTELERAQSLLKAMVQLLLDKRIITSIDLRVAEVEAMLESRLARGEGVSDQGALSEPGNAR